MADRERATLPEGGSTRQYDFCSFVDLLIWLKGLALDPYNMKSSQCKLQNQILKVRRLLNTSDAITPQRKRKFKQYINDGKFAAAFGLTAREKYDNQNVKSQSRGQSSSPSRSPPSKEKSVSLQGKQGNVAFPAMNDAADCVICREDFSHLSDTDEPIEGPNPVKQGNLKSHCKDLVTSNGYTHSTRRSIREKPIIEFLEVLKPLIIENLDNSSENLHSLSSEKEDMELNEPLKFLHSRAKHLPRPVIPIGPRFQAEVPKWEGPTNKRHDMGDDDLRWLGTQIWPMPNITETNTEAIGKDKPESAFSSLKFDEICDDVSKPWTLKDHKKFESLVKLHPLSNEANFWKLVMEYFPPKSIKSMLHYYYNVYIPRRMSLATRYSFGVVKGGIDQNEDCENEDDCSTRDKECSYLQIGLNQG